MVLSVNVLELHEISRRLVFPMRENFIAEENKRNLEVMVAACFYRL